ncbi:MAG TPA: ABC transporter permease [Bacteroidales bacterium]|nr:ABC transporter permease [Bacteroidales bacterium]
MFRIFLNTFLRNARKNKLLFVINLLGFTLGLSLSIIIFLYIANELNYDRYHERSDRIYRLCIRASIGDTRFEQAFSSSRVLREMRDRYPEIEDGVKTLSLSNITARVDESIFSEDLLVIADSSLFTIFSFPMISGDPGKALAEPNSVSISESTAQKYFGSSDCLGEVMELDVPYFGEIVCTITGVFRDMPGNSHFHLDVVVSSVTFPDLITNRGWAANNFITYLLLEEGASCRDLEKKFTQYVYENFGGEEAYKKRAAEGDYWEFFLQPLERIHLYSDVNGEWETNGNIRYIYIFSAVALFVLIIACINFINLSIAKSTLRAKEVGIKKATGSGRGKLIFQFIGESAILTFVSMLISVIAVKLLLPHVNDWLDRSMSFNIFSDPGIFTVMLCGWLVVSILTGLYPAFFLSSYSPLKVLKANTITEKRGAGLRNILVIVQFAASIFLIIGTIIITSEMSLLQKGDLGFDKSGVMVVKTPASFRGSQNAVIDEMERISSVKSVSCSSGLPGVGFSNVGFNAEGIDKTFTLNLQSVDHSFDDVMALKMSEGRFFSSGRAADSNAVVLNETAVEVIGLENPIGKYLTSGGTQNVKYEIIGIVSDYHYESKHMEIRPLGLFFQGGPMSRSLRFLSIRYEPGTSQQTLKYTENIWNEYMTGIPFSHFYLADNYNSLYHNEQQTKQVFILLSIVALFVACLGLFGLASFNAQQQKAEVAIRKVMGASINELLFLLSKRYVRWLLFAFIIACPAAYFVMSRWLDNFAYKVPIDPIVFIVAGLSMLLLALATVSGITRRTAGSNPASVLRNE